MNTTRSLLLPATAFALMFGAAHAAGDPKSQSRDVPGFSEMDKNSDGALTRSEAGGNPRLLAHFEQVDNDGDGRLSRGEYLAIMARQDLHTVRETLAEFIDPEGKAPLAAGQAGSGGGVQASAAEQQRMQAPPLAASPQLVRNVQDKLQAKGVDAGPVDGIWGPRTHQGLREFQEKQGMKPTGQLNAQTLSALGIDGKQTASAGDSASAGATGSPDRAARLFEKADKNNDGYVGRQEFESVKPSLSDSAAGR